MLLVCICMSAEREGEREGGREGEREGETEGGREGGREITMYLTIVPLGIYKYAVPWFLSCWLGLYCSSGIISGTGPALSFLLQSRDNDFLITGVRLILPLAQCPLRQLAGPTRPRWGGRG